MQIIDRNAPWSMREHPFLPVANPAYFYGPAELKEVIQGIWSTVDRGLGMGILFGDAGSGKSMLCRKVAATALAEPDRYRVAVIGDTQSGWNGLDLVERVSRQFGLPPAGSRESSLDRLYDFLGTLPETCRAVLLIDDAHLLVRRGAFEALRILCRFELPTHKPLTLLCFARPGWMEALRAAPEYMDLAAWTSRIPLLSRESIGEIVAWRMKTAGVINRQGPAQFQEDAIVAVHAWSKGLIRPALHACRLAFDFAISRNRPLIDGSVVVEALAKDPRFDSDARENIAMVLLQLDREKTTRKRIQEPLHPIPPTKPLAPSAVTPTLPEEETRENGSSRDRRAAELLLKASERRKMKGE